MNQRLSRGRCALRLAQFRRAASQFMTTVIGAEFSSSALRLTRKRWPSFVTTY